MNINLANWAGPANYYLNGGTLKPLQNNVLNTSPSPRIHSTLSIKRAVRLSIRAFQHDHQPSDRA